MTDTSPKAVKEFKCCEPRLGYDCDFPNCHTKDELKAIIEDKQRQLDVLYERVQAPLPEDIQIQIDELTVTAKYTNQEFIADLCRASANILERLAREKAQLADYNSNMIDNYQSEIDRLQAQLDAAMKDAAFFRSCALSGEIPKEGAEPSVRALSDNQTEE